MSGMDLVEFLRARIDEDEHDAREALVRTTTSRRMIEGRMVTVTNRPPAWRSAMWPPERLLAEIEAKRRIMDEHYAAVLDAGFPILACRQCSDRRPDEDPLSLSASDRWLKLEPAPCTTLRLLALPYADHPDYQPEWSA